MFANALKLVYGRNGWRWAGGACTVGKMNGTAAAMDLSVCGSPLNEIAGWITISLLPSFGSRSFDVSSVWWEEVCKR